MTNNKSIGKLKFTAFNEGHKHVRKVICDTRTPGNLSHIRGNYSKEIKVG